MIVLALAGAVLMAMADTVPAAAPGTAAGPRDGPAGISAPSADTTPRKRAKAVELSDAYGTRLAIHKLASWATLPLFAAQFAAGEALYNADGNGTPRPEWARTIHKPLAYSLAGLFAVNSVTGALNWWETRHDEKGRTWRTVHAALMLASDAGFAYAGSLGNNAKQSYVDRDTHRNFAMASMAVALGSYVMMLAPIRGDR